MNDIFTIAPPQMPKFSILMPQLPTIEIENPVFALLPMINPEFFKQPIVDFIAERQRKTMSDKEISNLFADILEMEIGTHELLPFFGSSDFKSELTRPSFRRKLNPEVGPVIYTKKR